MNRDDVEIDETDELEGEISACDALETAADGVFGVLNVVEAFFNVLSML